MNLRLDNLNERLDKVDTLLVHCKRIQEQQQITQNKAQGLLEEIGLKETQNTLLMSKIKYQEEQLENSESEAEQLKLQIEDLITKNAQLEEKIKVLPSEEESHTQSVVSHVERTNQQTQTDDVLLAAASQPDLESQSPKNDKISQNTELLLQLEEILSKLEAPAQNSPNCLKKVRILIASKLAILNSCIFFRMFLDRLNGW